MPLTPSLRKQLRARAHALDPVLWVGGAGISEAVLAEADRALDDHELIKVRLPAVERAERAAMAGRLCEALGACEVQAIGRVRVIYRERPAREPRPARAARRTPARRTGGGRGGQR